MTSNLLTDRRASARLSALALAAGLGLSAPAQAQAPAREPAVKRPEWLQRPRNSDLLKALPAEAKRMGLDGRAMIRCEVARTGAVGGCVVVSEDPPGVGFGQTALRLAQTFRLSPHTVDGVPVDSEVTIPVAFDLPEVRGAVQGQAYVNDPVWLAGPTRAQMVSAYPQRLLAAGEEARAVLDCAVTATGGLDDCRVMDQGSADQAGEAALNLAPLFRMDPVRDDAGQPRTDLRVRAAIHFDQSLVSASERLVDKAEWAYLPDVSEMTRVFPAQAKAAGLRTGLAVLDCGVEPGGSLGDCKVFRESPPAMGFGAAALALAPGFGMEAWNNDGRPVDGARVRLPIRYKLD